MAAGFQVLTVTQLCRYVKSLLEEQRQLGDVLVKGEVTNLAYRQSSGHLYFSIRDEGGLIRCVMFSRYVQSLPELPEEGALVLVRGPPPSTSGTAPSSLSPMISSPWGRDGAGGIWTP